MSNYFLPIFLFKIINPAIATTNTVIIIAYLILCCPVEILIINSACASAPSPTVTFLLIIVVVPITYQFSLTTKSAFVSLTFGSTNPSGASISTTLYFPLAFTSTKQVSPFATGENVYISLLPVVSNV